VSIDCVVASPIESSRFGLRVGRCNLDAPIHLDTLSSACAGYDLVVLRCPADVVTMPAHLTRLSGFVAFTADHLCVWEWQGQQAPRVPAPVGWRIDRPGGRDEVADLIRASFAGYRSHYLANPLIDPAAALDGYCDWAVRLADEPGAGVVLRHDAGAAMGIALVDWSGDLPDVRLAGMHPSVQARGLYAVLLGAVIAQSLERGLHGVQISTQSNNVRVMRAWTRMGFVPTATLATYHLTRAELLHPPAR
jgi:GNAT superfamily N-acetyltransferase